jgi:hypothetical protein
VEVGWTNVCLPPHLSACMRASRRWLQGPCRKDQVPAVGGVYRWASDLPKSGLFLSRTGLRKMGCLLERILKVQGSPRSQ